MPMVIAGLLVSPAVAQATADCPSGWEFGPTLRLTQSDGWAVTVTTSGRGIGGPAVALPNDRRPLLRGTAEGSTDGVTMNFGIGWDKGFETHYSGAVNQTTGAVTGERPDGVTWKATTNMRCIGAPDAGMSAPADSPPAPLDAPVTPPA
jgi:hypothetical protein